MRDAKHIVAGTDSGDGGSGTQLDAQLASARRDSWAELRLIWRACVRQRRVLVGLSAAACLLGAIIAARLLQLALLP